MCSTTATGHRRTATGVERHQGQHRHRVRLRALESQPQLLTCLPTTRQGQRQAPRVATHYQGPQSAVTSCQRARQHRMRPLIPLGGHRRKPLPCVHQRRDRVTRARLRHTAPLPGALHQGAVNQVHRHRLR